MRILVTGAAGFIGYNVVEALLARGDEVLGVDCFTPYYARSLKDARVSRLKSRKGFSFQDLDIADNEALKSAVQAFKPRKIIHLAGQAGVRYSLTAPFAYSHANLLGHLSVLEASRDLAGLEHLVYASSSSVYGANIKVPFAETDPVDHPISLYAATKRSAELMSETYHHLFQIPQTGLRFFSVYGPFGRPDMVHWLFTEAILKGEPIHLFAAGSQQRDFTYIDDIVSGITGALDRSPKHHKLYNLGNHRPEATRRLVQIIESATGKTAKIRDEPARPGDVEATYADITAATRDFGFLPSIKLDEGTPRFVAWYRDYHKI